MRNDPRGLQGPPRGTRFRHPARGGWTGTALGGVPGRREVGGRASRTPCPHGFKPLLSPYGVQPLHSGPVQAFNRPSIAAPSLLALSRCQFSDMA